METFSKMYTPFYCQLWLYVYLYMDIHLYFTGHQKGTCAISKILSDRLFCVFILYTCRLNCYTHVNEHWRVFNFFLFYQGILNYCTSLTFCSVEDNVIVIKFSESFHRVIPKHMHLFETRVRSSSPLIVSRDSSSPWTWARFQTGGA